MNDTAIPTFDTPCGKITGWLDGKVIRATGIQYALAYRFQKPEPIKLSTITNVADKWASACPQIKVPFLEEVLGGSPLSRLNTDEHCQQLSVTLPKGTAAKDKLPVMVWIHGGSYTSGAGDADVFDVKSLVEEQQVIAVNITYRLGLFGFLGGYRNRPANLGLLDMVEALRWIKSNIGSFGGNSDNITLFGQSAGADAIANLMIAKDVDGLFHRAIVQSAPFGIGRKRGKMTEAMKLQAAEIPDGITMGEILEYQPKVSSAASKFGLKGAMPFGLQYGHDPLPKETDIDEAWSKVASKYDLLIGYTKKEASIYIPNLKPVQKLVKLPLLGRYFQSMIVRLLSYKVYKKASRGFAKRHAKAGGKAHLYEIVWGSKTNGFGATHTIDLPLLFGGKATWEKSLLTKGIEWEELEMQGKKLRGIWAEFARSGNLPTEDDTLRDLVKISSV